MMGEENLRRGMSHTLEMENATFFSHILPVRTCHFTVMNINQVAFYV